jgi:hypothetical protein
MTRFAMILAVFPRKRGGALPPTTLYDARRNLSLPPELYYNAKQDREIAVHSLQD